VQLRISKFAFQNRAMTTEDLIRTGYRARVANTPDGRTMAEALVTVIMPARNAAGTIGKSIQSVRSQSFKDWELIVIDDASEDRTAEIVKWFIAKDKRIRLLRLPKWRGVAAARNRGLDLARTRFIAFLDSDDAWEPQKLERQIAFMMESGTAITFGAYRRVDVEGNTLGVVVPPTKVSRRMMLRSNFIGNLTAVFDRQRLPDLRFKPVGNEDYVFWVNALEQLREPVLATPGATPIARYRVAGDSLSGNKINSLRWQWENYRRNLGFGLVRSSFYLTSYALHALIKRRPSKDA